MDGADRRDVADDLSIEGDMSTTGAETKKPRHRASAVCEAEGQLLLVRLRDPVTGVEALYPPGGGVEPNETPAETARRETLEETGVRIEVLPDVVVVDRYPFTWAGVEYDCTTHYFAAKAEGPPGDLAKVIDADYNLGALWLPTNEALDAMAIHPAIASSVVEVLRRSRLAEWTAHPNIGGPASMLLGIHDQFRRVAEHLLTLEAGARTARTFGPLASVLHHHHHAEERMLFPLVEHKTGTAPARLVSDHEELTAAIAAVETSYTKDAVARFERVLRDHLAREELLVVPVLLSLRNDEAWAMLEGTG